jgi:phage gp36-like protein
MQRATDEQVDRMKESIRLLRAGGDPAFATAWLVWAEVYLNTLEGSVVAGTEKILPLVVWLSKTTRADGKVIQAALHDSLTRILFQAKLAGRELNTEDGHTALQVIRSGLKEADG